MGGEFHHATCLRCGRVVPASPERICRRCRESDERDIERLTRAWAADLDLLTRFEAYCTRRAAVRHLVRPV